GRKCSRGVRFCYPEGRNMRKPAQPSTAIERVDPTAALPGGEVRLIGRGLCQPGVRPGVSMGGCGAEMIFASPNVILGRVDGPAVPGPIEVYTAKGAKACVAPEWLRVGHVIAENLHPVCNPAVD